MGRIGKAAELAMESVSLALRAAGVLLIGEEADERVSRRGSRVGARSRR
ncbi:MAG: hypothetical protein HY553_08255 [Elusimicrobia bacterium]|nr:hypothetical protein [Elusimicrobiota bacterium]